MPPRRRPEVLVGGPHAYVLVCVGHLCNEYTDAWEWGTSAWRWGWPAGETARGFD